MYSSATSKLSKVFKLKTYWRKSFPLSFFFFWTSSVLCYNQMLLQMTIIFLNVHWKVQEADVFLLICHTNTQLILMGKRKNMSRENSKTKARFYLRILSSCILCSLCTLFTSVWGFLCFLSFQCLDVFYLLKLWYSFYSLQSFTALVIYLMFNFNRTSKQISWLFRKYLLQY